MGNKKKKILYISGTGADYGLMKDTLTAIKNRGLDLQIVATGEALMEEQGNVIKEIEKDGFAVEKIGIPIKPEKKGRPVFLGEFLKNLSEKIEKINPDIILIMGDRAEMMAGALAGAYFGIPVAHIHGGEVTMTADESIRHAITKLSTYHFSATQKSAERIEKIGEDSSRIFYVGAPGFKRKEILQSRKEELAAKFGIDLSGPFILVIQHPTSIERAEFQIKETMEAIKKLSYYTVIVLPNTDPGGKKIKETIYRYKGSSLKIIEKINRDDFLDLMKIATVLIGNSSCGIIEAPFFNLPVVNIGERQNKRERAGNLIDVGYDRNQIEQAVLRIMSEDFKSKINDVENPYYRENTEEKIAEILDNLEIIKGFQKQITY